MRGGEYTFLTNQVKGFNIEVFEEDGPDAEPVDDWGPAASDPERIGLPAFAKITLTIELKPRIDRESMDRTGRDRRTIDYVRYVRFPERLRFEEEAIPRLTIPSAPGAAGEGDGTDPDDPTNDPGNLDPRHPTGRPAAAAAVPRPGQGLRRRALSARPEAALAPGERRVRWGAVALRPHGGSEGFGTETSRPRSGDFHRRDQQRVDAATVLRGWQCLPSSSGPQRHGAHKVVESGRCDLPASGSSRSDVELLHLHWPRSPPHTLTTR